MNAFTALFNDQKVSLSVFLGKKKNPQKNPRSFMGVKTLLPQSSSWLATLKL